MATLASFFGWRKPSKKERLSTIVLSWDKRYFDIAFQDFPNGLQHATVKDLKQKAKEATGVPIATMRLKVSGGRDVISIRLVERLDSCSSFQHF